MGSSASLQPLALHAACFSFELHDVLFAFCDDKIIALAASKKAKLLQEMGGKLPETFKYKLEVLTRDKTDKDKVLVARELVCEELGEGAWVRGSSGMRELW